MYLMNYLLKCHTDQDHILMSKINIINLSLLKFVYTK